MPSLELEAVAVAVLAVGRVFREDGFSDDLVLAVFNVLAALDNRSSRREARAELVPPPMPPLDILK